MRIGEELRANVEAVGYAANLFKSSVGLVKQKPEASLPF
jgi:hypothetical protein